MLMYFFFSFQCVRLLMHTFNRQYSQVSSSLSESKVSLYCPSVCPDLASFSCPCRPDISLSLSLSLSSYVIFSSLFLLAILKMPFKKRLFTSLIHSFRVEQHDQCTRCFKGKHGIFWNMMNETLLLRCQLYHLVVLFFFFFSCQRCLHHF